MNSNNPGKIPQNEPLINSNKSITGLYSLKFSNNEYQCIIQLKNISHYY